MGGGPSVANITKVVNDAVTTTIANSIQFASDQSIARQTLNIDCQDMPGIGTLSENCFIAMKQVGSTDAVGTVCGPQTLMTCGVNGVTISGAINVNLDSNSVNNAKQQIANNIKTNIASQLSQETNAIVFSSDESNELNSITTIVQNLAANFIQNDLTNITQTQTINLKDVQVRVVSLKSVIDLVQNNIISSTTYQQAINDLSNSIVAQATQKNKLEGPLTVLMYVFGIIVGILVVFGLALWIIKKNRK